MRTLTLWLLVSFFTVSCGTSGNSENDLSNSMDSNASADQVSEDISADMNVQDTSDCPYAPFSPPGDPCMMCTCGDDPAGPPACSPVEVGTPCISDDCCVTSSHCVQCEEGDLSCPASELQCTGDASVNCSDNDPCTLDLAICDGETCSCSNDPAPDGAPCIADENACTAGDSCQSGLCVQGTPLELESDNVCVELICVKGVVEEKILSGDCSDGDPCTLGDSCKISGDSAACIPDALVECPDVACATASACDSDLGECVVEWGPIGNACETNDPCSTGTCASNPEDIEGLSLMCVANPMCPVPAEPCLVSVCDPEATSIDVMCSTEMVENGTMCVGGGVCNDGDCSVNAPPSAPTVNITPADPGPGVALVCTVTAAGVDPEGETVTYEYRWLRDGQPTAQNTENIVAGVTNACETWTCEVTPWADGLPGLIGSDFVVVGSGTGGAEGPTYKAHSWVPGAPLGSWGQCTTPPFCTEGFGNGEAVAVRITFEPEDLPYTIGVIRGLVPPGQQWRGAVWQDDCGSNPCAFEIGTGVPVIGSGPTGLVESTLNAPVTVTSEQASIVVGFVSLSGDFFTPAGPMYYDGDGAQGNNWILGSLSGGGVSWGLASAFGLGINDWVVEVGPGSITCD